jgi:alpha-L-rhamnosidase
LERRTFLNSVLAGTAATIVTHGSSRATSPSIEVGDLRCEYTVDPLGIDVTRPRLSWIFASARRGDEQTAYQVLVSSSEDGLDTNEGDLWDSGKVLSSRSTQVPYEGRYLSSRQRCYWKVRVWNKEGHLSRYSKAASWEMGLLSPTEWKARWIGFTPGWNGRALYFRYDIDLQKAVKRGRVYVAGLGYYELHINGVRVGDHVLDPGWTTFSKRVLYSTYDVDALLKPGRSTVGVIVGNGWYGMPKLLLQIEVTYSDDTQDQFYTHGHYGGGKRAWFVTSGPILNNSIYDGEVYDARLEKPGWDLPRVTLPKPANRIEGWVPAHQVEPPGGRLVSQMINPVKIAGMLEPKKIEEPGTGVFVYDFGQNAAGWAELRVKGKRGTQVTLKFAENLYSDGTVNQENLIKAAARDVYVLKGGEEEAWEPRFTYHGFRYVQVEGFPGRPEPRNLLVKVIRSSVQPNGVFETSNELINRIHKMVWWTEASNLYSVPTDCPQRSERMGWLNDLTVRAEESVYNFDVSRFFTKFLDDIAATQEGDGSFTDTAPFKYGSRPADPVDASYLLLAWLLYQHYGDTRIIAEHFSGFKAWTDFLADKTKNGIVTYGYYGDWSPPTAYSLPNSAVSRTMPLLLMSTGFLYYCSRLVSEMAQVLGKEDDKLKYNALARKTALAFNREYFNDKIGAYGNNDESANSFALFLGLVPSNQVPRVLGNLVRNVREADGHLTTGNLCTKYLLEALTAHGRAYVAYEIVTQRTYPSWGYMLANGATTLWERWENLTGPGMNSHNHPMMGSVDTWFYKYIAGINPDPNAPGFKRFVIHPHPVGDLSWARSEYTSMYGKIRSAWHKQEKSFHLNITVPGNTKATVFIPARDLSHVTEGGRAAGGMRGVKWLRNENGAVVLEVGSGDYEFRGELE